MALQIEVTKVSASDSGEQFKGKVIDVLLNLTCWPDGVTKEYPIRNIDGTVDMKNAVIFQDFPGRYKVTDEQTVEERLTVTVNDIILRMQAKIDCYKREAALLANAKFDLAVTAIQNGLEG